MPKKRDYITQGYIEQVEHYVYNDLPILEFIEKNNKEYDNRYNIVFDKKFTDSILLPGEKYGKIPEADHCIVTSFGRVFNTSKAKPLKVTVTNSTIYAYVGKAAIVGFIEFFEQQGWDFDYDTIVNNLVKHKCKFRKVGI